MKHFRLNLKLKFLNNFSTSIKNKILVFIICICILLINIYGTFKISMATEIDTDVVHVSATGNNSGDGSPEHPYSTLKKAIEEVKDHGVICLDSDLTMVADNKITKNITIKSHGENIYTLKRNKGTEGNCLWVQNERSINS